MVRANALDGSRWFDIGLMGEDIPLPSIENSNESSSQSQSRQTRQATKPRYFGVLAKQLAPSSTNLALSIPNGWLDAHEVKVDIDIFKYQEKVTLISQFQRFFHFSMAY